MFLRCLIKERQITLQDLDVSFARHHVELSRVEVVSLL
jgi:hypothetical protein